MQKEIVGYTVENWEDSEVNKLFYATKSGTVYFLSECPQNTPSSRISEIKSEFKKYILDGSNVNAPEYFKNGTRYVCIEPYISSILYGYGAKSFLSLASEHRQRILLGAVNALQTLHWAGLVHGGIGSNCFRVCAAKDGSFRTILAGLAYAGKSSKRKDGYPPGFRAPEMINGAITEKTDIYALGVVFYFWLTRSLPVHGENQKLLIPSCVPGAYGKLLTGLLASDPQKRITLDTAIEILHNPSLTVGSEYIVYYMENSSGEFHADYARDIQEIHSGFTEKFSSRVSAHGLW